jgi:predicted acyltransferase (DUF342 family)
MPFDVGEFSSLALGVNEGDPGDRAKLFYKTQNWLTTDGSLTIDLNNVNNGTLSPNSGVDQSPGLLFGVVGSEGIASKRTAGGNQNGLDFYTNATVRLSITNSGNVSIGSSSAPGSLTINGALTVGSLAAPASLAVNGTTTTTGALTVGANLTVSGNVKIGTGTPADKLDVAGSLRILTDSNPIRFTSSWSGFPDAVTNQAEISNDTGTYKTLMIIGNKSADVGRRVSIWDRLEVNGDLLVTGNISGKLTGIGIAIATLSDNQAIPIPSGFTKAECVFFAYVKSLLNTSAIPFNCLVENGVVRLVREAFVTSGTRTPITGGIFATGIALAKKGGW